MPEAPKLPDDWTEPERWAWQQIAAGKEADFNARAKEQGSAAEPLGPKSPDGWTADRRLRAGFLQRILTDRPFIEATPFRGVRIVGALVDDQPLNLEYARLGHSLWLDRSRIETSVKARFLRVCGVLSFEASYVAGHLDLTRARIEELLILIHSARFEGMVDLTGASIGGQLDTSGSSFAGPVSINSATISGGGLPA